MCTLSHSRSIEDRTYTAIQKFVDREVKDETLKTTLQVFEDEVADFNKDWEDDWHPMIGEQSTGIIEAPNVNALSTASTGNEEMFFDALPFLINDPQAS